MGNLSKTEQWYKEYYQKKGKFRNSLLYNPEVVFQTLAHDLCIIKAMNYLTKISKVDLASWKILDVGCGGGGSLFNFIRLGFKPNNMYGVDILPERIEKAKNNFPDINWQCQDAQNLHFENSTFDIVLESTMFVQIIDDNLALNIAKEMIRVTKPGRFIFLIDWRTPNPFDKNYKALTKKRISLMFNGQKFVKQFSGSLLPPIGRLLSKRLPAFYFVIQKIFPFLVGQKLTILQKAE